MAATEEGVAAHVLSAAMYLCFCSQGRADFTDLPVAAMCCGVGGHLEKAVAKKGGV